MLVAIDTSTRFASLALYEPEEGRVLSEESWLSRDSHTVELVPGLVRLLERQGKGPEEIKGVAVALGPGSFTGLRIGLAVAKGLALGLSVPLVGIPTLDVLAYPFAERGLPLWAIVGAGRGRICAALYNRRRGRWRRVGDYHLTTFAALCAGPGRRGRGRVIFCGEIDAAGKSAIQESLGERAIIASPAFSLRRAGFLAEIGWGKIKRDESADPASLAPIYLHTSPLLSTATSAEGD